MELVAPCRPSDAALAAFAIAELQPMSDDEVAACQRIALACFTAFPVRQHTPENLARLMLALGQAQLSDRQIVATGATLAAAAHHVAHELPSMHPKYAVLALTGAGKLVHPPHAAALRHSRPSRNAGWLDDAPKVADALHALTAAALPRITADANGLTLTSMCVALAAACRMPGADACAAGIDSGFKRAMEALASSDARSRPPLAACSALLHVTTFLSHHCANGAIAADTATL